jgi:hypothetical protein
MKTEMIEAAFCDWWNNQSPHHRTFFERDFPEAAAALRSLPFVEQELIFAVALREGLCAPVTA